MPVKLPLRGWSLGSAGGVLAAPEHFGPVYVIGGQVGDGPAPFVLVLDAHQPRLAGWQRRVATAAGLDRGLLVAQITKLAGAERLGVEDAGVEVQHDGGLGGEVRARGKIQDRWNQGRMASRSKIRHTVAAEIAATTARATSSRASSAQLQRERGTPVVAGSSQASCLTSA